MHVFHKGIVLNQFYPILELQLKQLNAGMVASESHGALCARFCVENQPDIEAWMHEVLGPQEEGNLQADESRQLLMDIYRTTNDVFSNALEGFEMLLPDDELALPERLVALTDWCEGFIAGLGMTGIQDDESLDEQVREILRDLIEITQLDDEVDESEENESSYFEVEEYVKVAVMTVGLSLRVRDPEQTLH